jgi:hypothetical protein
MLPAPLRIQPGPSWLAPTLLCSTSTELPVCTSIPLRCRETIESTTRLLPRTSMPTTLRSIELREISAKPLSMTTPV